MSHSFQTIADEIRHFSERYRLVLTSGGIGPTHDDVTFEAVAKAFGDELAIHPQIAAFVREWFKTEDESEPCFRLATVPSKAQLNFGVDPQTGQRSRFPVVSVKNVFVFPGVPPLLQKAFLGLDAAGLFGDPDGRRFFTKEFFLSEHETAVAKRLNELVKRHPKVTFGSYPKWPHPYYKVLLTAESSNESDLISVEEEVDKDLPVVMFDPRPWENAWDKIQTFKSQTEDEDLRGKIDEALNVLCEAFDRYGREGVSVCFNGGKDCIVMMHLTYALLKRRFPGERMQTVHIKIDDPFAEVEEFVAHTEKR